MEWSIQHAARLAGTTSRALRHYDELGVVPPSRVGRNGYRYYDERALVRLQRVLLLRGLGLGLAQIAGVLADEDDEVSALTTHLSLLREEQDRLARQIAAVEHTITALTGEEELMAETMFDGFEHTEYRDEVEQRWGSDAYARSDQWWRGLSDRQRGDWKARAHQLGRDWIAVADSAELTPDSPEAQELARRHVDWLRSVPGTPAADPDGDLAGYVRGLAEMYVCDARFAANYGGAEGAVFVRDALLAHIDRIEGTGDPSGV
ncbi:MerR family transcriptional regulator [Pseudoclavibacter chungangensis]|uniref:MerR family transcriptional regulator n=1 Tax=Pseudoclavibacter chungangensis TaxID=587635 RepID=A0A7J5C1L4_9MICO|nr:TipAS antibiotic-recognition domain-containing protein [Pseudoclavibacter chungangensis]KAB1660315.1 MerR family transcriptional regulator [Pseudoclavibacter chungangensis]NYJ65670.1 DNA-binding transcriptional MerR regulator [Pseudoclavibacter chungangensis]